MMRPQFGGAKSKAYKPSTFSLKANSRAAYKLMAYVNNFIYKL